MTGSDSGLRRSGRANDKVAIESRSSNERCESSMSAPSRRCSVAAGDQIFEQREARLLLLVDRAVGEHELAQGVEKEFAMCAGDLHGVDVVDVRRHLQPAVHL